MLVVSQFFSRTLVPASTWAPPKPPPVLSEQHAQPQLEEKRSGPQIGSIPQMQQPQLAAPPRFAGAGAMRPAPPSQYTAQWSAELELIGQIKRTSPENIGIQVRAPCPRRCLSCLG